MWREPREQREGEDTARRGIMESTFRAKRERDLDAIPLSLLTCLCGSIPVRSAQTITVLIEKLFSKMR